MTPGAAATRPLPHHPLAPRIPGAASTPPAGMRAALDGPTIVAPGAMTAPALLTAGATRAAAAVGPAEMEPASAVTVPS